MKAHVLRGTGKRGDTAPADDGFKRGYVIAVGGITIRGQVQPDPLAGVAHGAALLDVAGIGERGDVLGQRGLADPQQVEQAPELDLPEGVECRAKPQPDGGVDKLIESVLAGVDGRVLAGARAHERTRNTENVVQAIPSPDQATKAAAAVASGASGALHSALSQVRPPASSTTA